MTPPTGRLRHWTTRATRAVTLTTAGGVVLLGAPVLTTGATGGVAGGVAGGEPAMDTPSSSLRPAAAERRHWPGHPNRALVRYRVRPGDTATGLAVRFHAWTRELRRVNHLGRHSMLYVGRVLRIPVVRSAARHHHAKRHHLAKPHHHATHHHARHHHARHHHARHHHARHHRSRHHRPWRMSHASRATVRRVIVRTARHHGVRPRTLLAIAWQESGWQQRRRSSAGAVGAMQILPGTGRWMSLYVGRRLNIYSLRDNVTAGVVLFKVLRRETTARRSIAAYYQGLGSIRAHGRYRSTKHYVRNVVAIRRALKHGWRPR